MYNKAQMQTKSFALYLKLGGKRKPKIQIQGFKCILPPFFGYIFIAINVTDDLYFLISVFIFNVY